MRATVFLTAILLIAVVGGAARAESLAVRRVISPLDAEKLRGRRAPNAALLTPSQQKHLDDLGRRWRSFPDVVSRGKHDWSLHGARRKGWQEPARGALPAGVRLPTNVLRVAFIRIDFLADRGGSASTGDGKFDLSGPDTTVVPFDRPPRNRDFWLSQAEALHRYHEAQNFGRTAIETEVWPRTENGAYHLSDMADYGPWTFGQDIYGAAVHMMHDMFMAADSQSTVLGDRIPWDQYDRFVIVHAGSDLQSDVAQDSKEDIPSFTIGVADTDVTWIHNVGAPGDSFPIDRCSFVPETNTQDGYFGAVNGTIAHECGHLFYGFFDVYDVETGLPVVGFWSLMDSGNQVGSLVQMPDSSQVFATGLLPPSIDAYQRQMAGDLWVPVEAAYGDTVTLRNGERNPDVCKVTLSSDEFLLIENRYQTPVANVDLDQDPVTHVVLGPKNPDPYEYDALLPGGGLLVWHVDESVIPFETYFPLDTSLRVNPDFAVNSNPARRGLTVVEADGLGDLGDPSSPYLFGAPFDPFFVGNNWFLSDSTHPNLLPNTKTYPHVSITILDTLASSMRLIANRAWQRPGWPIHASFPDGGPQLLAVDADGDDLPDVCWAGGDPLTADSTGLFAVKYDGTGVAGGIARFALLDRRPLQPLSAVPTGEYLGGGLPTAGPSLFAVTTLADGPDTSTAGGRVWLLDHLGAAQPGWPPPLPAIATTPPVLVGIYPNTYALVGGADGRVYMLRMDGSIKDVSAPLPAPIVGRLAAFLPTGSDSGVVVAYGDSLGAVSVTELGTCPAASSCAQYQSWNATIGPHGWRPDFVWLALDGKTPGPDAVCASGGLDLVVRNGDRLDAYCSGGQPIAGWGGPLGDTLVAGLGAGDVNGDGMPEVITQTIHSGVMFVSRTGRPSPGWPKRGTREDFRTTSAPLALDLLGDSRTELVALNASGILAAFNAQGGSPAGWPLATGVGVGGSPLATDFNSDDGAFEIVAPDHLGKLYAYSLPQPQTGQIATPWTMLGGDPGRSSTLPAERTGAAPAPSPGPLVKGSFKAYPNPARRSAVTFAYTLTEPARVQYEIVDTSGHRVASFTRDGRQSDNIDVWDPGRLPAGLYLARISFHGAGGDQSERIPIGLLR